MAKREPIAIVGVSTMYPGSSDALGFWRDILAGRDMMQDIPETHWLIDDFYDPDPLAKDKVYAKRGAFLSAMPFDLIEFGMPPASLPAIDAMQLMGLIAARDVLLDAANGRETHVPRDRVGVYLGIAGVSVASMAAASRLQKPLWVKGMREAGLPESLVQKACEKISENYTPLQENTFPGLLSNVVAGRIANRFDLGGTNYAVDAACASSLAAISAAMNDLYLLNADMCLCGGIDMQNNLESFACFSKTPALSPTGDIRPFSADCDGTMLGEGVGLFAMRRLADAERDGDKIYAVVKSLGVSSDGRAKSVYAPRPQGQSVCMKRAYELAEYDPMTVELLEAHGTATTAGDVSEFESMRIAFGDKRIDGEPTIALGSIKSQIGHTKGAAGAASLFKVMMALHHKVLPPTTKVSKPNPKLKIEDSPFYLNTEARPWVASGRHPRRASVSSFGFGGTNFHMALEEYQGNGARPAKWAFTPTELVLVSADSRDALAKECAKLASAEQGFDEAWRKLARSSHGTFDPEQKARLAVVVASGAEWTAKLTDAATDLRKPGPVNRPGFFVAEGDGVRADQIAFVFAGQGSQALGMGSHLTMTYPFAQQVWDAAEPVLLDQGVSLRRLVFAPPVFEEGERAAQMVRLTATENLQPALAVQGMLHLELMRTLGIVPVAAIGHSFGELLALHAAGVMDARSLLLASRRRGELMSGPDCPAGAMTAVNHGGAEVARLVREWNTGVVFANYNSPTQTVLSGTVASVQTTEKLLHEQKIQFRRLPVSAAFHSPLVAPAVEPFHEFLRRIDFSAPHLDVLSNTDLASYPADPEAIRAKLAQQLALPVRFSEQVESLYARGVRAFVELGMGNTLSTLIDQTLGGREHFAVPLERKGQHGLTTMWEALGRLSAAGLKLDLAPIEAAFGPVDEPIKPKNPAATVYITGAPYGKPYPPKGGTAALPKPNPETEPRTASLPMAAHNSHPAGPFTNGAVAANGSAPSFQGGNMSQSSPASSGSNSASRSPEASSTMREATVWSEIHRQIELAQQTTQSAILETHSLTLRSLERLALGMSSSAEPSFIERPHISSQWKPPEPTAAHFVASRAPVPVVPAPEAMAAAPRMMASSVMTRAPSAPPVLGATLATETNMLPSGPDIAEELLDVVSDKTGYPVEVLDLDTELEAGLGIDSIKRVEIFSAIQQKHPNLPEVNAEHMASLRTLRQIIDFLDKAGPTILMEAVDSLPLPNVATETAPLTATTPVTDEAPATPSADVIKRLLLDVVAEKTGYPVEVLDLDTELEAGLGIDSIKRVEIFSAVQQQQTGLPEVTAEHMASLRTLRQIISFLENTAGAGAKESTGPSTETTAEQLGSELVSDVARLEVFAAEMPLPNMPMSGVVTHPKIAVKDDGPGGIAAKLVEELCGKGLQAYVAGHPVSNGSALILTAGFGDCTATTAERSLALHLQALDWMKALHAGSPDGAVLVTVTNCGGDFNLSGGAERGAWAGGLGSMAKTAVLEWKDASVKSIDVDGTDRDAGRIASIITSELLQGGDLREVGFLADGRRVTLKTAPAKAIRDASAIVTSDSVLVVSGGGRGVTAACLIELARAYQPKLILLGRTRLVDLVAQFPGLPRDVDQATIKRYLIQRAQAAGGSLDLAKIAQQSAGIAAIAEIEQTLAALRQAGSQVLYRDADVSDVASVAEALVTVRKQFGPISGIVHAAGVLADKLIQDKTPEQFRRVFATKVAGMEALFKATEQDPIRLIVAFSSVSARYGNAGQCDYAAGNEVLNQLIAVEAQRRGSECLAKSLSWGPWEGGMVTPGLAAQFKARGVGMIPLQDGARQFVAEVSSTHGSPQIVLGHGEDVTHLGAGSAHTAKEQTTVDFLINSRTFPMLAGHVIRDENPTLPMVFAVELFSRVAEMRAPEMEVAGCADLRMLRGVIVTDYLGSGVVLRVDAKPVEGSAVRCELRSRAGDLHYSGRILLRARTAEKSDGFLTAEPEPVESPENVRAQYPPNGNFHGAEFQVIRTIEQVDEATASTTLAGVIRMGWQPGPWVTDSAALDGAVQTVGLWYHVNRGAQLLPTRLGQYLQHKAGLFRGPFRCEVRCRHTGSRSVISDLLLRSPNGEPIAELQDLEMHALQVAHEQEAYV